MFDSRQKLSTTALLFTLIFFASDALASYALQDWNMDTRQSLPLGMKLWLGAMMLSNISSLFFVKNHIAARWVFGMLVASHTWVFGVEYTGLFPIQGGLVSLGHIVFWAPAIYAFYRYRSEIILPSAFGIWACIQLFFYTTSLVFDFRDAFIWISAQLA